MKYLTRVLAMLCGSVFGTMVIAAMGVFSAMFSTPGDSAARTEKLWGAVYFETFAPADGVDGVDARMGVANGWVLAAIFAALFVFMLVVSAIYDALVARRRQLLEAQRQASQPGDSSTGQDTAVDSSVGQSATDDAPAGRGASIHGSSAIREE